MTENHRVFRLFKQVNFHSLSLATKPANSVWKPDLSYSHFFRTLSIDHSGEDSLFREQRLQLAGCGLYRPVKYVIAAL